jgi:hypothetical protein
MQKEHAVERTKHKELPALEDLDGDGTRFGYPQQPTHEGCSAYQ